MPTCKGCGRDLPAESFDLHCAATGKRKPRCKDCQRDYFRAHYRANREAYIERAKVSNRKIVAEQRSLIAELRRRPCADCGKVYPPHVMEFDHREPDGKVDNVADMPKRFYSRKRTAAELAKCDLVCANCHREREFRRKRRYRTRKSGAPSCPVPPPRPPAGPS